MNVNINFSELESFVVTEMVEQGLDPSDPQDISTYWSNKLPQDD